MNTNMDNAIKNSKDLLDSIHKYTKKNHKIMIEKYCRESTALPILEKEAIKALSGSRKHYNAVLILQDPLTSLTIIRVNTQCVCHLCYSVIKGSLHDSPDVFHEAIRKGLDSLNEERLSKLQEDDSKIKQEYVG